MFRAVPVSGDRSAKISDCVKSVSGCPFAAVCRCDERTISQCLIIVNR